jgi:hypothetical protein
MHFEKDSKMLLEDPVVDDALSFGVTTPAEVVA